MNRRKGYWAIAVAGAACAALILPATTAASASTAPTPAAHGTGARIPTISVAAAATPRRVAFPASADLTPYAVPVGDQGQVGSCVTWAIDYAMTGLYASEQGRSNTQFAPMYVYSQIQAQTHRNDEGANPSEAYNITRTQGVDTEADYRQGSFNWRTLPTAAQRANAAYAKTGGFADLYANNGYSGSPFGANAKAAVETAVSQGRPVALSMAVLEPFFGLSPQHPWLLAGSSPGATDADVYGYHEVLIVGYDARGIKIQNSWGTGWGAGGFGYIEWGYLARTYNSDWQSNAALVTFELSVLNPFKFPALHATTLSESAPASVRRGAAFTVSTSLRPTHGGTPVTLQYSADNRTWRTVSTFKTNSAGNAGWRVSTTANRYYRVVYAGDPGWTPAHSRTALVRAV